MGNTKWVNWGSSSFYPFCEQNVKIYIYILQGTPVLWSAVQR
jgi:hypothetical protein